MCAKKLCLFHAVLKPGFKLVSPGDSTTPAASAPCEGNTYNPGNNRVTSCTQCPSGLVVAAGSGVSLRSCRKWEWKCLAV